MAPQQSQRHPAEKVRYLDFADDIVEMEESSEKAQSQLDLLGLTAKEVGLHINTTKTKLITCNIPHASLQPDGEDIEHVLFSICWLAHCVDWKRRQAPERESMECVLEIGSCLEVSCITSTKGATV